MDMVIATRRRITHPLPEPVRGRTVDRTGPTRWSVPHRGGVADTDDQTFGAEEAGDGLAPWFGASAVQERVALVLELLGGVGDVVDLELDGRLRRGHAGRPLLRAEARVGGLLEWPEPEMLRTLDLPA